MALITFLGVRPFLYQIRCSGYCDTAPTSAVHTKQNQRARVRNKLVYFVMYVAVRTLTNGGRRLFKTQPPD